MLLGTPCRGPNWRETTKLAMPYCGTPSKQCNTKTISRGGENPSAMAFRSRKSSAIARLNLHTKYQYFIVSLWFVFTRFIALGFIPKVNNSTTHVVYALRDQR